MGYSILDSGNQQKRQAIGTFDLLASQERQQNLAEDRMEQAQDAQRDSAIGTTAGMAGSYAMKNQIWPGSADAAQTEALTSGVTESNAANAAAIGEEALAAETIAAETVAAETAIATEGAVAAEGAIAAETALAAEGAIAAEGAVAATGATVEAAGTAATMGPVGWVAAAGILAYSLFG